MHYYPIGGFSQEDIKNIEQKIGGIMNSAKTQFELFQKEDTLIVKNVENLRMKLIEIIDTPVDSEESVRLIKEINLCLEYIPKY